MEPLLRSTDVLAATTGLDRSPPGPRAGDELAGRRPLDPSPAPRLSHYLVTVPTVGLVTGILGTAALLVTCLALTLDTMALTSLLALLRLSRPRGPTIDVREAGEGRGPRQERETHLASP
ncbi:MAG: hypothetical protein DMD79_07505 [Candidatus Rokuibacteriota bacterium]|nr:MAG: hypothetical protein DMD79_07505 [Candidatus Rokubacteria bacterium]